MPSLYTEADYENSVIELFENMGYTHVYGPDIERDFTSPLYDEVLEEIAMYTFDNGDLRTGINLLRSCGNIAEADASREIKMEHFNQAVDSMVSVNVAQILSSLSDLERSLLELIIESEKNITAGALGEAFREKEKVSYSSYNRTLDKLEFLRLIDTKYTGSGVRGNSREVILRFDPDDYDI